MLALALLVFLPALLVVRAPWTAVPALSLAFWALSAAWPSAVVGRGRVAGAAFVAFFLLLLLRFLPKHEVPPPPGWVAPSRPEPLPRPGRTPPRLASAPSAAILVAAIALLAPAPLWRNAPGPRLAFHTTAARLALWRDGWPLSFEPLLPLAPFGAHAPALATLAADLSRLSGADPAQSVALLVVAAAALTLVGLFSLYATVVAPEPAALAALLGLALAPWPGWLEVWGAGEALVALAFLLPASALLVGHASRASAVAAGMLIGAGSLAQPVLAVATAAVCAATVRRRRDGRGTLRLGLAFGTAVFLAAPGLEPLAGALSWRESTEVAASAFRVSFPALGLALPLVGLGALLLFRAGGRFRAQRIAATVLAVASGVLLVARVQGWMAAGQISEATRAALREAADRVGPLDSVCAAEGVRDWVPALAGRAAGEPGPWIPAVYAEEWADRRRTACRSVVDGGR